MPLTTWTLTLAGLRHTTVVLKDRHEARKLIAGAEYEYEYERFGKRHARFWHLYGASGYLGCVSCRVEKS